MSHQPLLGTQLSVHVAFSAPAACVRRATRYPAVSAGIRADHGAESCAVTACLSASATLRPRMLRNAAASCSKLATSAKPRLLLARFDNCNICRQQIRIQV